MTINSIFRLILLTQIATFFVACDDSESTQSSPDQRKNRESPEDAIEKIEVNPKDLCVTWMRDRSIKEKKTEVRILGADVEMEIDKLDYSSQGEFTVTDAEFILMDGNWMGGKVSVDLTDVIEIQVDKDKRLKPGVPEYLDVENYPESTVEFDVVSIRKDTLILSCDIYLKGEVINTEALGLVPEWKGSQVRSFFLSFSVDALEHDLLNKDADQKVEKDMLFITVKSRE